VERSLNIRQNLTICITGTPGVGKTSVSRKLAILLRGNVINVGTMVIRRKLFSEYDEYRDTYIVDENSLRDELRKVIRENKRKGVTCIIDTHLLNALQGLDIDLVIVLTCDPLLLLNRNISKGASLQKSIENAVSEFLNQILIDVFKIFDKSKIIVIDTSCKDVNTVANEILNRILSKKYHDEIDWKQANWSFRAAWISKLLTSTSGRI